MKITLTSEESIRLEASDGVLTIEAESYDQSFSPYHMIASGLASCTHSVLASWATHANLKAASLSIEVTWKFVENPHRLGQIALTIVWPDLPKERWAAAERAAALCPVHHTFKQGPAMMIEARS
ncbi:MAG TPA: OsmC family protein [Thermoanaerobaculia bacterium]|nr:OsmC family protein [Thermoanaerobaculia bacterium]